MKIIISKAQFNHRKQQILDFMAACEASYEEIEKAAESFDKLKTVKTDLLTVIVDNDDVVIVVDDTFENEIMDVLIDNAPMVLTAAKALAMVWKAFSKKMGKVYEKHVGHFYDQLVDQFGEKE